MPIKCSTRNDIQKFLKIILNWVMKVYDVNLMKFYKKIEFFKDPNEMLEEKDVYTFEEFQIKVSKMYLIFLPIK